MKIKIFPLIIAGGQGTRLWPLSRSNHPKQFINILGDMSLFEKTLMRCSNMEKPVVITHVDYRFHVQSSLDRCGMTADILLEPESKNTALAISSGTAWIYQKYGDVDILVLPSDHEFFQDDRFIDSTKPNGNIITFGVKPTYPETGYGYIEAKSLIPYQSTDVIRFVEKPDLTTAQDFIQKNFLWNSGMFAFSASVFLDEVKTLQPEIYQAATSEYTTKDFVYLNKIAYSSAPSISIDYAIMEKSNNVKVIPIENTWSDMGSLKSIWDAGDKDENKNMLVGDVTVFESNVNLVISNKPVVLNGISNSIVIQTDDVLYVGMMDSGVSMRKVVDYFKNTKILTDTINVMRPWGSYFIILEGERFKVKSIKVSPGEKLSLQKHMHRSEHWVVVRGTAEVVNGDATLLLTENESTYIPLGEVHRLRNPGKIDLEIIEIQTGSYLGEDDIIRYDDDFGR